MNRWGPVLSMFVAAQGLAQVPQVLGYQGRLLKSDGTAEVGVVSVIFKIYGVSTGGQSLWDETQQVAVSDGFYSLMLGSQAAFPSGLWDGADKYLELAVGGAALAPRQPISSVAYALLATNARNVVGGTVTATSVAVSAGGTIAVGGKNVIDASGQLALDRLPSCAYGQVLQWSGATWACTDITASPDLKAVAISNLVKNADMEIWNATNTAVTYWSNYGSAAAAIANVAGYYNASAVKVTDGDIVNTGGLKQDILSSAPPSLAGTIVTFSVWAKWSAGAAAGKICIADAGPEEAETSIKCSPLASAPASTAWAKTVVSHTVSSSPQYLRVILNPTTVPPEAGSYLFDGAMLVNGTYAGPFASHITEQIYAGGVQASQIAGVVTSAPLTGGGTPLSPLAMPAATGAADGYLAAADWTKFNNKVTSVAAGDTTVVIGGTASAPTVAVNPAGAQARVTGTCPFGISAIAASGTVTCAPAQVRFVRSKVGQTVCAGTYTDLTGLGVTFTASGTRFEIWGDVPVNCGSHSALRATVNGSYAGTFGGVPWSYVWLDGLQLTSGSCGNWVNLRYHRVFDGFTPGTSYTVRLQLYTDGACCAGNCGANAGNGNMDLFMGVRELP